MTHHSEEISHEIFNLVRPKCVTLANLTLSSQSLKAGTLELTNALKDLDSTLDLAIQKYAKGRFEKEITISLNLADYIAVPLIQLFKLDGISDSELQYSFSIIDRLLSSCWCKPGHLSRQLFIQYTTFVIHVIGGKPGAFDIGSHSSETFSVGVKCLNSLLNGCLNQNDEFFKTILDDTKYIPTLGFMVSTLLNIALESPIVPLKQDSLQALNILFHLINDGEVLSLFFPGTISAVCKLVKFKPHSNVLSQGFVILTTMVNQIFSDFELGPEVTQKIDSLDSLKANLVDLDALDSTNLVENCLLDTTNNSIIEIPENTDLKKVNRTTKWLKETLIHFEKALQILLDLDFLRYDKKSVKDCVFQFDIKIIRNCFTCCRPLIPLLLKSLASICSSDSSFTSLCIESLAFHSDPLSLRSIIYGMLENEITSMQYNFTSPDPIKSTNMLSLINVLIRIDISIGHTQEAMYEKLITKICENITLLVEIKSTKNKQKPVKRSQENIETQLLLVTSQYLGSSVGKLESVDIFNGIVTKETETQIYVFFNTVASNLKNLPRIKSYPIFSDLKGSREIKAQVETSVSFWALMLILNQSDSKELVYDDFLNFDVGMDEHETFTDNSLQLNQELVYKSLDLSIDVLKNFSSISDDSFNMTIATVMSLRSINYVIKIQGHEFADELINVLYPIVECLASSDEMIRIESQIVVMSIADLLYDGSVQKLLFENSDYLVDSLSSKLVSEALTPKVPIILAILVKIGPMDIISELDDVIKIIFTLMDVYYGYDSLIEGFFLVFDEVISKIYESLRDYDFDLLQRKLVDDDVNRFGVWGLQSFEEVDEFVKKNSIVYDDVINASNEEQTFEPIDEPIQHSNFLEIDSDDSDDSDDENDTKSIPSRISTRDSKKRGGLEDGHDEDNDADEKWESPIDMKLYHTVSNVLSYAERLVQSNSISLSIILLTVIKKIIPILATQKSKFLPISVTIWELSVHLLNEHKNLQLINLNLEVLKELITYGSTFFTSRFVDLFNITMKNKLIESIVSKQIRIINKQKNNKLDFRSLEKAKLKISTDWESKTFTNICDFLIFALNKLGRFVPNDIAISITKITIFYDNDFAHYGFHGDLSLFMKEYLYS